jgi:exopolysaccharide biosynthesis predicted pyruvyltransferase EpsI
MYKIDLPASMQARFTSLMLQVQDLTAGKTVYYHPNHGNWGDGLIMAGTRRFLADAGIEYTECYYKKIRSPKILRSPEWLRRIDRKNSVLIYGGGGGWCNLWDISGYVGHLSRYFSHTIVLPSTFELKPQLRNGTVFCRDQYESQEISGAEFFDDMAFYMGRQPGGADGQGIGNFFRTDAESAGRLKVPANNRDISLEHNYLYPEQEFFAALSGFDTIHTDRLHISIASCLLGKAVRIYPGSYFKNKAVFRSSMQEDFSRASFTVESSPITSVDSPS